MQGDDKIKQYPSLSICLTHILKAQRCFAKIYVEVFREGNLGGFHYNALLNKDAAWQIGSVSAFGMWPLQVINKHATHLYYIIGPSPIQRE